MSRWKIAAALAAVSAFGLSACSSSDATTVSASAESGVVSGGDLVLSSTIVPETFDPSAADWGMRAPYYQAVYDTLLMATSDGELEPWLATDWEYNDDNTVLTLNLRDDVTFTDGTALNADVVVENLTRFRDGTSANAGNLAAVETIEAADEDTVTLTLSAPDPALLNYLARDAGLVASGDALDNEDLATNPVGSGPYILDTDATVIGTSYVYTVNPDYWDTDAQHYDSITIRLLDDATAIANAIQAGEIDAGNLTNNDNNDLVESAGWTIQFSELNFEGLLLLDRGGEMNEALGDVRVRQAINYAFDRDALAEAFQDGLATTTTQVFPADSDGFDSELDDYYTYDPDKARELLDEAGYGDGLTIAMPTVSINSDTVYNVVAQQLADVGITVEYTDAGNNFIADLLAPKYPASFMGLEQNSDWQLIQFMISPVASFNPFGYEDETVDALIEEYQFGDAETQVEAVRELNAYLVEQAWFAPFYRQQSPFATSSSVSVELLPSNGAPNLVDFVPAGS